MPLTPKDLLDLAKAGFKPHGPVAYDTETSGLYTDDGARVSTVSVAWEDDTGEWLDFARDNKDVTWAIEEVAPGVTVGIVSLAWPFDQGVAGTGKPEDHGQGSLFAEAENLDVEEWDALLDWLSLCGMDDTGAPGLIAHNAKFDVQMVAAGVRRWPGRGRNLLGCILWDTQVVNDLIFPLHKTSLKPTAARLFGGEREDESKKVQAYLKAKKLPTGRWDLMPWDIVGPYAEMDPRLTLMLYLRQIWEIENQKAGGWLGSPEQVYNAIDRRMDTMRLLCRMEWRGLPYDEVGSREAADECKRRAIPLGEKLPFKPTLEGAKNYYFGKGKTDKGIACLDLVPYSVTEKGSPQLTEEILGRMVADEMPFARNYAEYKKVVNAASMWYDGYADKMGADGRLRCVFRQNGTVSTRFSVERVNLQAIPQDYRLSSHSVLEGIPTPRQLIASAVKNGITGWKLWELDLAQAELRVAAMFARCKKMLRMIEEGTDLHTFTTQALFHIGEDDDRFPMYRQVGKRGNFSLIFGSGPATFKGMVSKETGIILGDSESFRIVRDWNALYPEYASAIDLHMNRVIQRQNRTGEGWIDLLNGERRWFQQYEDAHKAFNQRVQPNLAQFGIDWMLTTDKIMRDAKVQEKANEAGIGGAGLLLTIHDSQVLLLPDNEYGDNLAKEAQNAGRQIWANTFAVPGDVDMKVWSK